MSGHKFTIFCFLLLCCLWRALWFSQLLKALWVLPLCFSSYPLNWVLLVLLGILPTLWLFPFLSLWPLQYPLYWSCLQLCSTTLFTHSWQSSRSNFWLFTRMLQTFQRFPIPFRIKSNFSAGMLGSLWSGFNVFWQVSFTSLPFFPSHCCRQSQGDTALYSNTSCFLTFVCALPPAITFPFFTPTSTSPNDQMLPILPQFKCLILHEIYCHLNS